MAQDLLSLGGFPSQHTYVLTQGYPLGLWGGQKATGSPRGDHRQARA